MGGTRSRIAMTFFTLSLLAGCARIWPWSRGDDRPQHDVNPPGRWHVVKTGETLLGIALQAGIPLQDLMEINGIDEADKLTEGQLIYVLVDPKEAAAAQAEPASGERNGDRNQPRAPPSGSAWQDDGSSRLRWPVDVPKISSPFGQRWGRPHEGIDFDAVTGTPVKAAEAGEVIYAGDQVRGYGNMVVIQHGSDLITVYAHNSVVMVKRGDRITRGQTIARVGQSGKATGPHLHFEVRDREIPRNPRGYLPKL